MKNHRTLVAAVATSGLLLGGCASTPGAFGTRYVPVVDLKDQDANRYQRDLVECQTLAEQRGNTAQSAMAGAVAAALIGAIVAPSGHRNNVAGRSALLGAGAGAGGAIETQQDIVRKCLVGRGYRVLN
jgi:hypothetical protein